MVQATQHASTRWEGAHRDGRGTVTLSSGATSALSVSWSARTGRHASGKTSPEELLAAAHASCYAMALAHTLEERGTPPQHLIVTADCTLEQTATGYTVGRMTLIAGGKVAGITEEQFVDAAQTAEKFCSISNALRGNVEIALTALLIPVSDSLAGVTPGGACEAVS